MKPKTIYAVLSVAGLVLPYWQFVPWVLEHGLNLPLMVRELFANRIGGFFGLDVIVASVALISWIQRESAMQRIRLSWLPTLAVLTVGVSLGLPLFLYLRESALEAHAKT